MHVLDHDVDVSDREFASGVVTREVIWIVDVDVLLGPHAVCGDRVDDLDVAKGHVEKLDVGRSCRQPLLIVAIFVIYFSRLSIRCESLSLLMLVSSAECCQALSVIESDVTMSVAVAVAAATVGEAVAMAYLDETRKFSIVMWQKTCEIIRHQL